MEDEMIASAHMLTGALIGLSVAKKQASVFAAIPALALYSLGSHVLLDLIPHVEPATLNSDYTLTFSLGWWMALLDNLVGAALLLYWSSRLPLRNWFCVLAVLLSWVPDLIHYLATKQLLAGQATEWVYSFHELTHVWKGLGGWPFGTATTLAFLCLCAWKLHHEQLTAEHLVRLERIRKRDLVVT